MKEGWEYKKLGEVAFYPTKRISSEMVNENNYVGVDNLIKDRGGKVVANFFPAEGNVIEYLKGDVLLGNIRPYLKKIWLSDTKGGASGDVLIIRANDTKHLYPNYLYWALASDQFFEYDNLHCKGAKMPRGNKIDIMQYLLPIPTIEEQQQIVSELDLLSEVIEKHKAQLEELDKLAQSIFYDMFGDPVTNEKGWEIKKLKDIASKIGSGATPRGGNQSYKEEGISLIRSMNVHNNYFIYDDLAFIDDEQAALLNSVIVESNDVLLNITGASVARCCMVPDDVLPARVNQHVCIIRPIKDLANSIYLNRFFTSIEEQSVLLLLSRSNAATREALPKNLLDNCNIVLPPLSLQQEFAAKIEAIEAMKAKVRQSLKEAETLFNERMDYYFN